MRGMRGITDAMGKKQELRSGGEGSVCVKAVGSFCRVHVRSGWLEAFGFFQYVFCCFSFCQYFSIITFIALKTKVI